MPVSPSELLSIVAESGLGSSSPTRVPLDNCNDELVVLSGIDWEQSRTALVEARSIATAYGWTAVASAQDSFRYIQRVAKSPRLMAAQVAAVRLSAAIANHPNQRVRNWHERKAGIFDVVNRFVEDPSSPAQPPKPDHWYDSSPFQFWFLPIDKSWQALAFMPFWEDVDPFGTVLLKEWNRRYGADLIRHDGTTLMFDVQRRPTSIEEAVQLATEHMMLAECMVVLGATTIEYYVLSLLEDNEWFLHQKP